MTRMTDRDAPHLVLVGPPHHGVVRYASDLAAALAGIGAHPRVSAAADSAMALRLIADLARVHLHVTDRIFGSGPEDAADRVERLGRATHLSITLHDLPQPSDGRNFDRRRHAYARFMDAAAAVAVSSNYEAQLVERYLSRPAASVRVIPIGTSADATVPAADAGASKSGTEDTALVVLIGGFVYPGKGHLEAITAAGEVVRRTAIPVPGATAAGARRARVVAIGAPSAGHEADVDALQAHASTLGVAFEVTGYLDDVSYRGRMAGTGIPVAAHQHVSASRSMTDWMEQGRRALVVDSPYAREMAQLRPGTMTLYDPARLADHLEDAWRRPHLTRLAASTELGPTLADSARAYLAWWQETDHA